jgi:dTDP-4-dehydrorhamnose 3,5-epimerase
MQIIKQEIPEVLYFIPKIWKDERGYFFEAYHQKKWQEAGFDTTFVQDNQSSSKGGTLRGLHFQLPPYEQGKLVRVLKGKIFDVAVDIRKNSPTFKKWVGKILSAENNDMLYIPPDFAHGFYVLSEEAEVLYKCTKFYNPKFERSIKWDDKEINIAWPINKNIALNISEKDAKAPSFKDAEI